MQQQQQLNTLQAQGAINPYVGGNMTNQAVQQGLESLRNAQQYSAAQAMNQINPATGYTYAQMENATNLLNTGFQYANQGTMNQSALASAYSNLNNYAFGQQGSVVQGLNNQQLQQMANMYGNQAQYQQGLNYNTGSGVGGMTWGQLNQLNQNNQNLQQYQYNQNAQGQSAYQPGMTNQQVSMASSNAGDAASLQRNQYALSGSAYSGGQNRIQFQQGISDLQDAYNNSQAQYQLQHQQNQQNISTYNEQVKGQQMANTAPRTMSGLGFSSLSRPQTQGFS